jgi:fructose/tagatose bisphosphate aldolase
MKFRVEEYLMTNPNEVHNFVSKTGIDALSVAIGNVSRLNEGHSTLNFNLYIFRLKLNLYIEKFFLAARKEEKCP